LLEEQGVATAGHGRRLKAEHCANRQLAGAERTLRHGHEPICRKEFVSAPRLDCRVPTTNAFPWNISIQFLFMDISIEPGTEFGSALVPDRAWCLTS